MPMRWCRADLPLRTGGRLPTEFLLRWILRVVALAFVGVAPADNAGLALAPRDAHP